MKIVNGVLIDDGRGIEVLGVGDGISDDRDALQATLDMARPGDHIVLGPRKHYKINSGVTLNASDVTIVGDGATLDSSGYDGNALTIKGDNCGVFGLNFKGPDNSTGIQADTIGQSRGIYVEGHHAMVRDCRLEGFRAGGIVLVGEYATVQGNDLIRVRNYRVSGGGLGSIHAWGGYKCIIVDNIITEVQNCGIGVSGANECIIAHNYIEAGDPSINPLYIRAMGIVFMNGGNYCIIDGNYIRTFQNEGIILSTGGTGKSCSGNIVTNNQLVDTNYHAINLRAVGGKSTEQHICQDNIISHNRIFASAAMPVNTAMSAGICYEAGGVHDYVIHNIASNNMIVGENGKLQRGFRTLGNNSNVSYNPLFNNTILNATIVGIQHAGFYSDICDNQIRFCQVGIISSSGRDSKIKGNQVIHPTTDLLAESINIVGNPARLEIRDNRTSKKINTTTVTGNSWLLEYNKIIGQDWFGFGTLVNGKCVLSNPVFKAEHSLAVLDFRHQGPETIYIKSKDPIAGTVTIASSSGQHNGTFEWCLVR